MNVALPVFFKVVTVLLRLALLFPALTFVHRGLEAFWTPTAWIQPVTAVWYLPVFSAVFGMLLIMPYFGFLFRPRVKLAFLAIILVTAGMSLRHSLLPFYYESPKLAANPQDKGEFDAAKARPNGDGFASERTVNGVTLWHVQKPDYSPLRIITSIGLALVPVLFFAIRSYEVRRGITWRNFISPPVSSPNGHAETPSPAP